MSNANAIMISKPEFYAAWEILYQNTFCATRNVSLRIPCSIRTDFCQKARMASGEWIHRKRHRKHGKIFSKAKQLSSPPASLRQLPARPSCHSPLLTWSAPSSTAANTLNPKRSASKAQEHDIPHRQSTRVADKARRKYSLLQRWLLEGCTEQTWQQDRSFKALGPGSAWHHKHRHPRPKDGCVDLQRWQPTGFNQFFPTEERTSTLGASLAHSTQPHFQWVLPSVCATPLIFSNVKISQFCFSF